MPNRGGLLLGVLMVLLVGVGLGVMLYAAQPALRGISLTVTEIATPAIPLATATRIPPTPVIDSGVIGRLETPGQYYSLIWVEDVGYSAWNRAFDNRDQKTMKQVMDVFETLRVPDGTLVKITTMRGDLIQVEVLGGSLSGRRGWIERDAFFRTAQR